jgi:hypothetical protein
MNTKKELLEEHLQAWLLCKYDRKKRGEMTRNISSLLRIHPKSVGRAFTSIQLASHRMTEKRGRSLYYDASVQAALYDVWNTMDRICAENLHSDIGTCIGNLQKHGHWNNDDVATSKLCAMSLGTLKNRVGKLMDKYEPLHGRSTTRPSHLKNIIPIFKGPWSGFPPGYGQLDTVAHCGGSLLGDYMFSVNYTDACTYWVVLRAQWNKGEQATLASLKYIQENLPVPLQGIHPDTGTEFINWTLKKWADEKHIEMTRSEPGKSNDNMYVEERNGHVVRKYLKYDRYDKQELLPFVNEYYRLLSFLLNFFIPVRRTTSKIRVGAKYVRKTESQGKTPYARMLENEAVSQEVKESLRETYETLDIFKLKQELATLKAQIINIFWSRG